MIHWLTRIGHTGLTSTTRIRVLGTGAGLVLALLVIAVAQTAARLTWQLAAADGQAAPSTAPSVQPQTPGPQADSYRTLASSDLFGTPPSNGAGERANGQAPMTAPDTDLDLSLRGVLAYSDPEAGIAVVAADGSAEAHRPGDELPGGATLERVYPDRIILRRDAAHEMLRLPVDRAPTGEPEPMPPDSPAQRPPDGEAPGSELQTMRDTVLENPDELWDIIDVQPVMDGAELRGYHVLPRREEALFRDAGLRPEDVVTAINGASLRDPAALEEIVDELAESGVLEVSVLRDGSEDTVTIDLED